MPLFFCCWAAAVDKVDSDYPSASCTPSTKAPLREDRSKNTPQSSRAPDAQHQRQQQQHQQQLQQEQKQPLAALGNSRQTGCDGKVEPVEPDDGLEPRFLCSPHLATRWPLEPPQLESQEPSSQSLNLKCLIPSSTSQFSTAMAPSPKDRDTAMWVSTGAGAGSAGKAAGRRLLRVESLSADGARPPACRPLASMLSHPSSPALQLLAAAAAAADADGAAAPAGPGPEQNAASCSAAAGCRASNPQHSLGRGVIPALNKSKDLRLPGQPTSPAKPTARVAAAAKSRAEEPPQPPGETPAGAAHSRLSAPPLPAAAGPQRPPLVVLADDPRASAPVLTYMERPSITHRPSLTGSHAEAARTSAPPRPAASAAAAPSPSPSTAAPRQLRSPFVHPTPHPLTRTSTPAASTRMCAWGTQGDPPGPSSPPQPKAQSPHLPLDDDSPTSRLPPSAPKPQPGTTRPQLLSLQSLRKVVFPNRMARALPVTQSDTQLILNSSAAAAAAAAAQPGQHQPPHRSLRLKQQPSAAAAAAAPAPSSRDTSVSNHLVDTFFSNGSSGTLVLHGRGSEPPAAPAAAASLMQRWSSPSRDCTPPAPPTPEPYGDLPCAASHSQPLDDTLTDSFLNQVTSLRVRGQRRPSQSQGQASPQHHWMGSGTPLSEFSCTVESRTHSFFMISSPVKDVERARESHQGHHTGCSSTCYYDDVPTLPEGMMFHAAECIMRED